MINVVKYNLTQLTTWSKRYTCGRCCLAMRCVLSIVFLALCCFSKPFQPYYTPICSACSQRLQLLLKVGPFAMVSGLLIMRAAQRYFTVRLAERLVAGLFGIAFPLASLPLWGWGLF